MCKHPEPEWHVMPDLPVDLSATLRTWITSTGSLTLLLRSHGTLQVALLGEYTTSDYWCRDVVLSVNDRPVVIGRSVVPAVAMADPALCALTQLGARPLGDLIFAEWQGVRQGLTFAYLGPQHALFQLAQPFLHDAEQTIYARRSIVKVQQHAIVVHDVFLPLSAGDTQCVHNN